MESVSEKWVKQYITFNFLLHEGVSFDGLGLFLILFCSYFLSCLVVTFYFLLICVLVPLVFLCSSPASFPRPTHLTHISLVSTVLSPASLHLVPLLIQFLYLSLCCYSLLVRLFSSMCLLCPFPGPRVFPLFLICSS